MTTPDLPEGQVPGRSDDSSDARRLNRSRLEKTLVKGALWKQQTLRDIEYNRALAASESNDRDSQNSRFIQRLSALLDERNDEIERLRQSLARLKNEKSQLGRAHKRHVALSRAELVRMQDAFNQFEKESDSLLSELHQQNERLLEKCRRQDSWTYLK